MVTPYKVKPFELVYRNECEKRRKKDIGKEINRRLHLNEQEMFGKYYCLLLNPTPRWAYSGLGIDSRSGLPYPSRHREIIGNFLFSVSRIICEKRHCNMGSGSTRAMREVDQQLTGGCSRIYKKLLEQ